MNDTVFFERFNEWKKVMKNCPCRRASHPVDYCLYEGIPCCFLKCPRRVYERQLREQPPEPIEERLTRLEKKVNDLQSQLTKLQSTVRINFDKLLSTFETPVKRNVESNRVV